MNMCPPLPPPLPSGSVCLKKHQMKKETDGGTLEGWRDLDENTVRWMDKEAIGGRSEGQCLKKQGEADWRITIMQAKEWIIHKNPLSFSTICPEFTQIYKSFAVHLVQLPSFVLTIRTSPFLVWLSAPLIFTLPSDPLSARVILNAWACCSETGLRPTLSPEQKNATDHVK